MLVEQAFTLTVQIKPEKGKSMKNRNRCVKYLCHSTISVLTLSREVRTDNYVKNTRNNISFDNITIVLKDTFLIIVS